MKIKVQKRIKKTFAVLAAVMLAVCSMAFSVSADEVIFNGTITKGDENGDGFSYDFPSYVPLENGGIYEFTVFDQTVSGTAVYFEQGGIGGYIVDIPGFGQIASVPSMNLTQFVLTVGVYPDTIDLIITSKGAVDQSQDQVIFEQDVTFSNYGGSMLGTLENVSLNFIVGRDYEISVNGIKRVYTAQTLDDGSVYIGVAPEQSGEFLVGNLGNGLVINADSLLTAGTYPVKITLLGIKPPSFLGSVTDAIGSVLSWVGIPINEMLNDGGALVALLPLFGIGISIAAIFVGVKLIRSFTWGN